MMLSPKRASRLGSYLNGWGLCIGKLRIFNLLMRMELRVCGVDAGLIISTLASAFPAGQMLSTAMYATPPRAPHRARSHRKPC